MNALIYLTRKQIKNFFRDLVHHPGRLVAYLVMVALLVFTLVAGQKEPPKATAQYSDIRILHGIFLAWFLFLGVCNASHLAQIRHDDVQNVRRQLPLRFADFAEAHPELRADEADGGDAARFRFSAFLQRNADGEFQNRPLPAWLR